MNEILNELVTELKKYDRKEIAFKTGVSFSTLNNLILYPESANPRLDTLTALREFVDSKKEAKQ